jgi:hypothetical protein
VAAIINQDDAPTHLFNIPELDFSGDLFAQRLAGQWIRLGLRTIKSPRDERGVEDDVERLSLLLAPADFAAVFNALESVGDLFHRCGKPGGSVRSAGGEKEYGYAPFHRLQFPFAVVGEPLVFVRSNTSGTHLFINPDLWMYLELEEKTDGKGIWWDPRRGVDALVQRVMEQGNVETVEIRVDYLLKYLQSRQMSLIVGHYRQLLLFDPPQSAIGAFVEANVTLGSPDHGAKAILQNWGLRKASTGAERYLQRRLHLWFEIKPPEINVDDPWPDEPPFDPYTFTLPTRAGPVAPARWRHFRPIEGRGFEGTVCGFMDRIYFRQEVLTKYEGASGFDVKDDGAVSCRDYWGLVRSTARVGNELLSTAIGDFAEGVPFEEWAHWEQYVVEPPSPETPKSLVEEPAVPEAVNSVVWALERLNTVFADLASALGVPIADAPWRGSLDSLAGRQLKWVYPATATDDEFLKRATLCSTLFLDGLHTASLRDLLKVVGNLHQTFEKQPKSLGSRNLLQRLALMALLIEDFQPDMAELPMLVQRAEGKATEVAQPDLQAELERSHRRIRDEFAPLAFLYDLRTHGGLAHPPNQEKAAAAAAKLGLPNGNWHRTDYLCLLKLISESLHRISERLEAAGRLRVTCWSPGIKMRRLQSPVERSWPES